ncbi:MAG: hypothetical protein J0I12_15535 [Candidatus Eremiobacteraeota bacterium]|nr:hypothetical protein [Candidatus Eremiobacteraeota bacterium]
MMRRVLAAIGLTLMLGVAAVAQDLGSLSINEQLALTNIDENKWVALRELAQKMLEDPKTKDKVSTYFFMGTVLHNGEGDLPRAHWYLDQCIKKFAQEYGNPPSRSAPWGWLQKALLEQGAVSGEMDQYEEQIKTWDKLDELLFNRYGSHLPLIKAFYSWPLMKLGRESEAREKLKEALEEAPFDESTVVNALNSLGALEMETDHLAKGSEAFQTLLRQVRDHNWKQSVVYLRNAGEASACLLQFDQAEKLFLESTDYFDPKSFSNPWWDLATLYLGQARYAEAASALKKCNQWTHDSEAYLAQQTWAANQQLACELMLQLGMTERAFELATAFVDRPDRKGGDSVQRDQWEAANMIIFREAANAQRNAMREQMCWTKGLKWWELLWKQRDLAWQAYVKGQQAASTIVSHGRLLSCLRYTYAPGTVLIPNYARLELPTLLGPGTTLAALDQLESKNFETLELERPYLNAIRFEAMARAGRTEEALASMDQVLKELPASERLMATRVQARAAKIYLNRGDLAKALPLLQHVMEDGPGFMRNLEIELPVTYASDGSAVAEEVIGMCRRSPRFREIEGAFKIEVKAGSSRLLGPDNSVLRMTELGPVQKGVTPAAQLCAALHERFFAVKIDLSQEDIGSLDGVVTGTVQSKQMQEMFFPGSTKPDDHPREP